jgi:hypothetical protein
VTCLRGIIRRICDILFIYRVWYNLFWMNRIRNSILK